uniref:Tyrosine-protein phosphatase domain-containing protein n=1 Tax=Trichuris muris TaxID=70415 RepID=A0A5S6Q3U3_TRIMR
MAPKPKKKSSKFSGGKGRLSRESKPVKWIESMAVDMIVTLKKISSEYYHELPNRPDAHEARLFYKNIPTRRNRYGDIPCLDKTRVALIDARDGNDYIHANWVTMPNARCRYIMTQAPLPETTADFWSMVWQENVSLIVCLTKIFEQGKMKTLEYWPTSCGKQFHQKHGHVHIRNVGVRNEPHFALTLLEAVNEKSMERRKIQHYLYLDWPDHRVPICTHNFLQVVRYVDEEIANYKGTLVALQSLVGSVNEGQVPQVCQVVSMVRKQRAMAVQGPEQYLFLYWALTVHITSCCQIPLEAKKDLLKRLVLMKNCSTKSACSLSPITTDQPDAATSSARQARNEDGGDRKRRPSNVKRKTPRGSVTVRKSKP